MLQCFNSFFYFSVNERAGKWEWFGQIFGLVGFSIFYQVLSFLSTMCCISGDPVEDPSGRLKSKQTSQKFQVGMIDAPCVDGYKSWGW